MVEADNSYMSSIGLDLFCDAVQFLFLKIKAKLN